MPSHKRLLVGAWKFRKSRIAHERLESDHTSCGHFSHLGDGSRDQTAPYAEVGDRRGFERRTLAIDFPAVTVHGVELSGMSKKIVPPPAASA